MIRKSATGLMKHADFILLDLICMQLSFVIAYWMFHGLLNPYRIEAFQFQAAVLAAAQLVVIVFIGNYSGILKRGRIDEAIAVTKYMISVLVIALVYLLIGAWILISASAEQAPRWILLLMSALVLVPVVGAAIAGRSRIKEIKGGEEDDLGQY